MDSNTSWFYFLHPRDRVMSGVVRIFGVKSTTVTRAVIAINHTKNTSIDPKYHSQSGPDECMKTPSGGSQTGRPGQYVGCAHSACKYCPKNRKRCEEYRDTERECPDCHKERSQCGAPISLDATASSDLVSHRTRSRHDLGSTGDTPSKDIWKRPKSIVPPSLSDVTQAGEAHRAALFQSAAISKKATGKPSTPMPISDRAIISLHHELSQLSGLAGKKAE